jgi:hypothetical protein
MLNPRLCLIVTAALLIVGTAATADDAPTRYPAVLLEGGEIDCGLWAKARKEPPPSAVILEGNVIGFLNGLSIGESREFWGYGLPQSPLPGGRGESSITRDSVYLWLDKYCNENPLSSVYVGAIQLFWEHSEQGRAFRAKP